MTAYIEFEVEDSFPFDTEAITKTVISGALDFEKCPYEAEVNVVLTDPESIRQTNKEFRNIDRETDVLSFPMIDFDIPADFSSIEEQEDLFNPDTGELMIGDIMISVIRCKEQAAEYGHSELREYAFLLTHSILHLLGYDHMEPEEAKIMEEEQEKILKELKITRE